MNRIDRRSDIKIGIPFSNTDGELIKPAFSVTVELFTNERNKFIATLTYSSGLDPETELPVVTYTFSNCLFKDVEYINSVTHLPATGPILVVPANAPGFTPGELRCSIIINNEDVDFASTDSVQTTVRELPTNIEII